MSAFGVPELVRVAALACLLAAACVTDVRARRIPNVTVLAVALGAIGFALIAPSPWSALRIVGAGMATGLGVWLPFYLLNMVGAGDVKLFAAAAGWLGAPGALQAAALTALAGGVLSIALMIAETGLMLTLSRVAWAARNPTSLAQRQPTRFNRVPYALAIAAGVLGVLTWPRLV